MNFSAAVMLELQRLQILPQVDVISGVSGGAITGAYYGVDPELWNPAREKELRQVFHYDIQKNWLRRWFLPQNVVRYWLSDFTRSDIMVQVFNAHLYHDATFADLKTHPKILINATLRNDHSRFTFTDQRFNEGLRSDLARYGVANAVNASSAFPGALDDVTLQQYTDPPQYLHLYDGGPRDNLGVQAVMEYLLRAVAGTNLDTLFPKGCLIIVVDAAPSAVNESLYYMESDREFVDYFVNTNAIDASDSMLNALRETILNAVGIKQIDHEVAGAALLPDPHQCRCEVRHIALRHLLYRSDLPENDDFIKRVTRIKTKFWISDEEQDDLFKAAHLLTAEMSESKLLPAESVTRCGTREKRAK
jgi:predicted acylesterase/phospholipase RssA